MHCSGADDDAADNNDDDPLIIVLARGNCEASCVKCDRMGLSEVGTTSFPSTNTRR